MTNASLRQMTKQRLILKILAMQKTIEAKESDIQDLEYELDEAKSSQNFTEEKTLNIPLKSADGDCILTSVKNNPRAVAEQDILYSLGLDNDYEYVKVENVVPAIFEMFKGVKNE